jgi:hypothetical protein
VQCITGCICATFAPISWMYVFLKLYPYGLIRSFRGALPDTCLPDQDMSYCTSAS